MRHYTWGFNDDAQSVSVYRGDEVLFDVTLYDEGYRKASLDALRTLIGYANAGIKAGLGPEPVAAEMDAQT